MKEKNEKVEQILDFIAHFKGSENVFLNGCCYWFAWILQQRFPFLTIYYESTEGHFVAMMWSVEYGFNCVRDMPYFFDIRGDVSELYRGKALTAMPLIYEFDNKWYKKLMRDCRDFEPPED